MKFKVSFFSLVITLIVFQNLAFADKLQYIYNVQTTIDTSKLITYQVTGFSLIPTQLNLVYLEQGNTFQDELVKASVTTNIPDSDTGVQLQLKTSKLLSSCYDENQSRIDPGSHFVSIYLDDNGNEQQRMEVGVPMAIPMASGGDGFKTSDFSLWFAFGVIPDGARLCDGRVSLTVEMVL